VEAHGLGHCPRGFLFPTLLLLGARLRFRKRGIDVSPLPIVDGQVEEVGGFAFAGARRPAVLPIRPRDEPRFDRAPQVAFAEQRARARQALTPRRAGRDSRRRLDLKRAAERQPLGHLVAHRRE
jgi:hypothetical protein